MRCGGGSCVGGKGTQSFRSGNGRSCCHHGRKAFPTKQNCQQFASIFTHLSIDGNVLDDKFPLVGLKILSIPFVERWQVLDIEKSLAYLSWVDLLTGEGIVVSTHIGECVCGRRCVVVVSELEDWRRRASNKNPPDDCAAARVSRSPNRALATKGLSLFEAQPSCPQTHMIFPTIMLISSSSLSVIILRSHRVRNKCCFEPLQLWSCDRRRQPIPILRIFLRRLQRSHQSNCSCVVGNGLRPAGTNKSISQSAPWRLCQRDMLRAKRLSFSLCQGITSGRQCTGTNVSFLLNLFCKLC